MTTSPLHQQDPKFFAEKVPRHLKFGAGYLIEMLFTNGKKIVPHSETNGYTQNPIRPKFNL